MRNSLAIGVLLLVATEALAQRPSTLNMTCAEANDLVAAQGEVTLGTGANSYERFVTSRSSCSGQEHLEDGYAQTSDRSRCHIHYVCRPGRTQLEDF